jgi:tRNA pseudouridine55 synthase
MLLLGVETDTQDITGTILRESEVHVTEKQVREAVHSFVGKYEQIPPMYSALKVGGQKLCDLARKGITVERKAREVEIFAIDIISMDIPRIKIKVHCSKGTYIRTLCQDIGEKLGCYGCMESLLRTRVAQFRVEDALRLSEVEQYFADGTYDKILCPVDSCFMQYPAIYASEEADKLLNNGNRIPESLVLTGDSELPSGFLHGESCLQSDTAEEEHGTFRMYNSAGCFIGIYTWNQKQCDYKPIKLFMGQD